MADVSTDAEVQAYYDDFATTYERGRDRGYHALVDRLETELVAPYARGASVLEVGCGTGLLLSRIAPHAREAIGVDLSPGMLQRARARGLDVRVGSATELPFEDARFDVVYSMKVLAHVPDIRRALAEIARVTRPGGHALLEFYNPWSLRYAARVVAGARRIGAAHREDDVPTRWDSPRRVRELLPPQLVLERFAGVRVWTPAAVAHRVPLVRELLARAEHVSMRSPLARLGGFLVAVTRRT